MSPQRNSWAIITGASSGIGAAVIRRFAKCEPQLNCLAVGRRIAKLEALKNDIGLSNVHIVGADITTTEGISAIMSSLPSDASVKYLVHNAGMLGPIGPLSEIDQTTWRDVVKTNLEAPLFLTQALIPYLCPENAKVDGGSSSKARILHVSSGAAHSAYEGWGAYCITKAGFHMMYRCLSTELSHHNILVGSVRPGVVDTPMQDTIRQFDGPSQNFPAQSKFLDLKKSGKLESPENVAIYFHWLLSETSDEEFIAKEWDIRSSNNEDSRWKDFMTNSIGKNDV